MKKLIIYVFLFLVPFFALSQGTLVSVFPNNATKGQTLTVTITGQGTTFISSTPSGSVQGAFLDNNAGFFIYTSYLYTPTDDEHIDLEFSIPANAPTGVYDVNLEIFPPWAPTYIVLPLSFYIEVDGIITGATFFDDNGNGVKDTGEPPYPNRLVSVNPGNISMFTSSTGDYAVGALNGNYTVGITPYSFEIITTPVSYNVTINNDTTSGIDFGIQIQPGFDSLDMDAALPIMRCNQVKPFDIIITNWGADAADGMVCFLPDPAMSFVSAIPSASIQNADSVCWNFTGLQPLQSLSYTVYFGLPGPFDTLDFTILVNQLDIGGNVIFSSSNIYSEPVLCAFDPNDKYVNPPGVLAQNYTLFSEDLNYRVRFQNTGNDTAFNVVIYDTLDANLDLGTFAILNSSHPMITELNNITGIARFSFINILLPDSNVDEPASHGFINYRIKAQQGLPANTVIDNTAYIIFDSNAAVVTNTTINTMVHTIPVGWNELPSQERTILAFPNPFDEMATISFYNESLDNHILTVYDTKGQLVLEKSTSASSFEIKKDELKPGIYFFRLTNKENKPGYYGKLISR